MGVGRRARCDPCDRRVLHKLTHARAAQNAHEEEQSDGLTDELPEVDHRRKPKGLADRRAQELTHDGKSRGEGDIRNENSYSDPFRCAYETHLYIFVIFFCPVKTMALNYGSLEEVHGAPFGTRVPIVHEQQKSKLDTPIDQEQGQDAARRMRSAVESVSSSLPLDTNPETESFTVRPTPPAVEKRMAVRESFVDRGATSHADAAAEEKLSRILRLIEQNRTGYERPAVQDMVLYIFTGVFFLFTFDTFVQLGKGMRPMKKSRKA
jgi:hypothetical protein